MGRCSEREDCGASESGKADPQGNEDRVLTLPINRHSHDRAHEDEGHPKKKTAQRNEARALAGRHLGLLRMSEDRRR